MSLPAEDGTSLDELVPCSGNSSSGSGACGFRDGLAGMSVERLA
jgi:hypothetical protein